MTMSVSRKVCMRKERFFPSGIQPQISKLSRGQRMRVHACARIWATGCRNYCRNSTTRYRRNWGAMIYAPVSLPMACISHRALCAPCCAPRDWRAPFSSPMPSVPLVPPGLVLIALPVPLSSWDATVRCAFQARIIWRDRACPSIARCATSSPGRMPASRRPSRWRPRTRSASWRARSGAMESQHSPVKSNGTTNYKSLPRGWAITNPVRHLTHRSDCIQEKEMIQTIQTFRPRIAVIGAGIYGSTMLKCFSAAQKQGMVDLIALAEIDEEVLQRHTRSLAIQGYANYKEMLMNVRLDAVAIATPDHLHGDAVLAAADAGLHAVVPQPSANRSERSPRVIDACRRHAVMLFVDFHKRFDPAHMRLKSDMQAGRLGKIQYGYACIEDRIEVPSVWLRKWAAQSSPSWFLGVHFYDLVYWLIQSQPRRVYAVGHRGKLKSMGMDTLDSINARVEFVNGANFSFDVSWILPAGFPSIVNQQLRIVGEEGVVEIDSQDRGMFSASSDAAESLVINAFGAQEYEHPVWGAQVQGYPFASMIRFIELLGAMKNGFVTLDELKGKYPDGEDALVSTRIGEAVDRSIATGEWIAL